jgi:hypothetical protein
MPDGAISAIGADDPASDWILRPEIHSISLPPQAGALSRILARADVKAIMVRYAGADSRAIKAQAAYKTLCRRVIQARFLAVLSGGALVLPIVTSGVLEKPYSTYLLQAGTVLQYSFLAIALFLAAYLSLRGFFRGWMEARAEAELARAELFDHVMRSDEPAKLGELPLLPLALEYFRRYHLDVQQRYYRGRGVQHARAAGQTRRWRWILRAGGVLALIPLVGTVGAWFGAFSDLPINLNAKELHVTLLAAGLALSALLSSMAAISAMNLDERNAARYQVLDQNLTELSGEELKRARAAAAAGDSIGVRLFVDNVQRLLSAEHQEWIILKKHMARPDQLMDANLDQSGFSGTESS